jgi:hypothetical protein
MKPFSRRVFGGFLGSVTILETKSSIRGAINNLLWTAGKNQPLSPLYSVDQTRKRFNRNFARILASKTLGKAMANFRRVLR